MRLVGYDDRSGATEGAPRALVAAAIRGEREAQRQVWDENRRWVAAVLMAHKPRQADLEDLLQDVAMQFVRRIHELRDPGALRPWLRTVATNAAHASGRSVLRRRRDTIVLRPAATSGGHGTPDPRPDLLTGKREEARRLMELSERLPDGYREPLLLRCLQGLSYREIGQITGLPETTIETRIARGRRMLRELAESDATPTPATPAPAKPAPGVQIESQQNRTHATDGRATQSQEARTQDISGGEAP